jgi:hypothetical protein
MTPIELYLNDIQPCPRCQGLCNREHFAKQPLRPDSLLTYLWCERCGHGVKTLFTRTEGLWASRFDMKFSNEEPEKLKAFLAELTAARSVAATRSLWRRRLHARSSKLRKSSRKPARAVSA